MKAIDLINSLRTALTEVKAQGQESIPVSGLENYLLNAEKICADNQASQAEYTQLEQAQGKFQHDFEVWKVTAPLQNNSQLEMFKSVIESGQTALKSATLINGGAAVALLAFLGNLFTKDAPKGIIFPVAAISHAMLIFVIGVGCSGLASGFRYLSQRTYSEHWKRTGDILGYVAIVLGFAAFALFFWGGIESYHAIK